MEEMKDTKNAVGGTPEQQTVTLGTLASGQTVLDRITSHLHESAEMVSLLQQAFERINLTDQTFVKASVDFHKPIGEDMCVATTANDRIRYAQRERRNGVTRFVLNRSPEATSLLNIILLKDPQGSNSYVLITAFPGMAAEKEPWDPLSDQKANDFWDTHALVWDGKGIMPGTETEVEPATYKQRLPLPETAPKLSAVTELKIDIPSTGQ